MVIAMPVMVMVMAMMAMSVVTVAVMAVMAMMAMSVMAVAFAVTAAGEGLTRNRQRSRRQCQSGDSGHNDLVDPGHEHSPGLGSAGIALR